MSGEGGRRLSPIAWLRQQLRIDAMRSLFSMVELRKGELGGLIAFAAVYAFTDGVGLSVLLPVLQYAEGSDISFDTSGGGILWAWPGYFAEWTGMPLTLLTLLIVAFVPVILRQITMYANVWYSSVVANRIGVRMRVNVFRRIMGSDPDFFTKHGAGQLSGVVMGQTGVAGAAVLQVINALSIILQILIYVVMLSVLSLPLTVLAAASGIFVSRLVRQNMVRAREYGVQSTEISQRAFRTIVERLSLARFVKLRAMEARETVVVEEMSEQLAGIGVKAARLGAKTRVTADPLLMFSAFVTLYLGITLLDLRLSELGMLLYVLTRLNGKVQEINAARQSVSSSMAGLELVRDVLADAESMDTLQSGAVPFEGLRHTIELRNVMFRYPDAPTPTLHDISAVIQAGSFTALVGRSGAGKSTFVELLPRLRDASSGQVLYDGIDIRDFELSSLRSGIGYLTQSPMMFNTTVRENLLYGLRRTNVTDEEINHALEQAYASFVLNLPDGLETRLGDAGVRFSGGERQRLALARVLLDKPSLLILDEPTSALDSESEQYIQNALAALHGTTTIVVIAHRLATVIAADQLLVVEDGHIVQRGTHAELAKTDGAYRHLFESQLLRE